MAWGPEGHAALQADFSDIPLWYFDNIKQKGSKFPLKKRIRFAFEPSNTFWEPLCVSRALSWAPESHSESSWGGWGWPQGAVEMLLGNQGLFCYFLHSKASLWTSVMIRSFYAFKGCGRWMCRKNEWPNKNRAHSCPGGAYNLGETQVADEIPGYPKQLWSNRTSAKDKIPMEQG